MPVRRKPLTYSDSTPSARPPYDPLQFIVRAKNDHDHADYLPKTQCTPELKAAVEAVANSNTHEFGSTAAYVRWACLHGLEFLRQLHPEYPSNVSIIRAMEREEAHLHTRMIFMDRIEKTASTVFELQGRGMTNEAAVHVYTILSEVRKMNPDDSWRQVYISEIKKRFPRILTKGKIVSHVPEKVREPQPHPEWGLNDDAN